MIARIKSDNFNGKSVNITFTPNTGGTININNVVIPYDYSTDYPYGSYSIEVIGEGITCPLDIPNPAAATPTPTPTTTATPTPTITPTATPTPTPTPFVATASISPTGITQYDSVILTGSTNITSPTYIWSLTDFYDVSGNTITSYTGNPLTEGYFTSSGSSNVLLTITGDNTLYPGNPVTATTSGFTINAVDPDAEAFFSSVLSVSGDSLTQAEYQAVSTLVDDLKTYSLWNKFSAFYPFVGSTSSSTKWNLKDPRDLDAAFRITWYGGMTFNSDGVLGNSVNGYGDTHLNGKALSYTGMTAGLYINQNLAATPTGWYDMGAFSGASGGLGDEMALIMGFNNKTTKYVNFQGRSLLTTTAGSYTANLFFGMGGGGTNQLYQDTTRIINTSKGFSLPNISIAIGGSNRVGGASGITGRGYSVAFIGDSPLTISEIADFNTTINNFNTKLSR
jgi:hypothetical protein